MTLTPRALILNLLLGSEGGVDSELEVRAIVAACGLFGLPENNVRVALARALASGLLAAPRRGLYRLGPAARPLADEVDRWRDTESRMTGWNGDWAAVHVGAAGRSDRSTLRARERAFALLGLVEFERGLHLRPNNLAGGVAAVRERLSLLLPAGADGGTVFRIDQLAAADVDRACGLWDGAAISAAYREMTARLDDGLKRAHTLPLDRAARTMFDLGDSAIRRVVFDPLLPEPLVDAAARTRFIAAVKRFDSAGKEIWRGFLDRARTATIKNEAVNRSEERPNEYA